MSNQALFHRVNQRQIEISQKNHSYFHGTTTSGSNLLKMSDVFVIFVLYSKDLLVIVLMLFNL